MELGHWVTGHWVTGSAILAVSGRIRSRVSVLT